MNSLRNKIVSSAFAGFVILILTSIAFAQPPASQASWAGKYEGVVKDDTGEQKLKLDLLEDSGKYSGTLTTAKGSFKILKGQVANGTLTLEIEKPDGSAGPMSFRKNGEALTATFSDAGKNLTVDFRKAAVDEISGEWDAVADAQGQPFPFVLTMKLDGEKVTGSSNSQLGNTAFSQGTWKDGKLSILIEGGSGQIVLVAVMVEGKLSGEYDFAGQTSGKWVAIKKK
jgi:hypothetical protein